mgnify:CR=1 FL=1
MRLGVDCAVADDAGYHIHGKAVLRLRQLYGRNVNACIRRRGDGAGPRGFGGRPRLCDTRRAYLRRDND